LIFTPLLRSWQKHFTVVHGDQRGFGKTLGRSLHIDLHAPRRQELHHRVRIRREAAFDQFMAFNVWKLGTRFDVPFFLFQGDTDVMAVTTRSTSPKWTGQGSSSPLLVAHVGSDLIASTSAEPVQPGP
jgi:hypothetical protein